MSFKYKGQYLSYEGFKTGDIGYSNDIETIYKKCVELSVKHGVPLKEMSLETSTEYDSPYWEIIFTRAATKEEIEEVDAQEAAMAKRKREQYEALKKEFE